MWHPPLPNIGKVRVTMMLGDSETLYFLDHYQMLNIEPFVEYNGNKNYLVVMFVNEEPVISTPKLYLDEHINEVLLDYELISELPGVIESIDGVSFTNYLPQFGRGLEYISFPRASNYKGIKFGQEISEGDTYAFPVDLDKEDFEIWLNGIKLTLHLNRDNKVDNYGVVVSLFDIIKDEFYGQLLIAEEIDDYIELKPKGD